MERQMEVINELEAQSRLGGSQPSICHETAVDAPRAPSQATSKSSVHVQKYLNSMKDNPPAGPHLSQLRHSAKCLFLRYYPCLRS